MKGLLVDENQKKELLRLYPVLSEVDHQLLEHSLSGAKLIRLKKGMRMFDEPQPGNTLSFVLSGKVRVFRRSVNGRELSLYNVESGEILIVATEYLFANNRYNTSGTVKKDTSMIILSSKAFNNLLRSPAFREFILSLITKRVFELMQLVEEVAFHKLDRRLASILLQQEGHLLEISHQELADELGTVREMISRLLNSFSDSGFVRLGRGRIEILDESALKNFLAD